MKDKFINIIISFIILGIIGIIIVSGMIVIKEITNQLNLETATGPLEFEENSMQIAKDNEEIEQSKEEIPTIIENPLDSLRQMQTSTTNENVDYSNVIVNKYFYNQLDDYAKTIYKAFEANKEEMKTGTKQIEFGDSFSNLLSQENGKKILEEAYQSAIEAYTYDYPDVFYLNANKMFLNIETTTIRKSKTYEVYINCGNEVNYLSDEFLSKEEVENAIAEIEQIRNELIQKRTGDTYKDIKIVHDYLVDNIQYDTTISKPYIYGIYGALVKKICVCEGYARSMKYLLDYMGVPCIIIIGQGTNSQGQTENHAWNYVEIDGKWYAVDTTWDDPVIQGNGKLTQASKYRYFLKGSNEINKNHISSGKFSTNGKEFLYPSLNVENY